MVKRPIGLPPHTPVAQKIAEQCWLIVNSAAGWKGFNWYFSKDAHRKSEGSQWGPIKKNSTPSQPSAQRACAT